MLIKNYDTQTDKKKSNVRNKFAPLPNKNIMIIGYTGSGKTNLLLNLIYDWLYWDNIYICAKDIHEEKYSSLLESVDSAKAKSTFDSVFCSDLEDMVQLKDLDRSKQNIVVFDDFCVDTKAMDLIKDYFIRGRKKNCTVIFLSQSYYSVPKVIRLNCSYFCLFKQQDDREINNIHQNHSCGLSLKDFRQAYHEATSEKYSFLFIDKINSDNFKKLRKNFDHYLVN